MTTRMQAVSQPTARGMVFIHSTPAALCPHLEWALAAVLGTRVDLEWTAQPVETGSKRAEYSWTGPSGSSASLASGLVGFGRVRFEVTEDATTGSDGQRHAYTPSLGTFTTTVGVHGDILVGEDQIKQAIVRDALGREPIHSSLERLLGTPWDDELEVFRHASDDAPVRWLHQVV